MELDITVFYLELFNALEKIKFSPTHFVYPLDVSTLAPTTVNPLISLVFSPLSKVYQIRSFFKAFVRPHFLLKSEGKRGRNEKKLLCKISKIYQECLPHRTWFE